jgi:hypothetical protein
MFIIWIVPLILWVDTSVLEELAASHFRVEVQSLSMHLGYMDKL